MSTYELHERVCVPYGLIAERRHPPLLPSGPVPRASQAHEPHCPLQACRSAADAGALPNGHRLFGGLGRAEAHARADRHRLDHHCAPPAAAHRLGHGLEQASRQERDPGRSADLGGRREAVPCTAASAAASGEAMKAGSAATVDVLRCEARGAATASGRVMPKSRWLTRICRTVVMIMEPPGEPSATTGWPSARTIVGLMLLRGRLPPAGEFADPGWKLKSVSSLLSRNP